MNSTTHIFDQFGRILDQAGAGNAPWRFIVSAAILFIGLIVLEVVFRSARQWVHGALEKKGVSTETWNVSSLLPPLRLAATAFLLRIAEAVLVLAMPLRTLLHGLEALLLSLAAILVLFELIEMIDRLTEALPEEIRDGFPKPTVSKLKGVLRVSVLIVVAAGFIYSQQGLFPEWLWKYAWWRYLLVIVIINMVILLIRLCERFLSGMLMDLAASVEKTRTRLVLQSTIWPIRLLLITIAVYAVKEILPLPVSIARISEGAIGFLSTLAVVLFVYRLVDLIAHELTRIAQRPDNLMDQTFVQMIRVVTRLMVIVVGAIFIIRALTGKPMSALLAGLGIGGLAVALAAQDTLKNFFGSIMIMLDKPFDVGQRITIDGFDGIVEDIGFRSTRVRTLTGHQVTVPNEKMASSNIENIGRRPSIRRRADITITYDTPPEKVERAVEIIRSILENHEGMHPDLPPRVHFSEFNDASLNIVVFYWYHPPIYWDYLAFTERVNLQIMRAFETEGIEFAFPTTTTYLAQDDRRPLHIRFSGQTDPMDIDSRQSEHPAEPILD